MLMRTPKTEKALRQRPRSVKNIPENRKRFKGVNFFEKDPAIHKFATAVKDFFGISNITTKICHEIARNSKGEKVRGETIIGWFLKDTFRPQNYKLDQAGDAIGLERVWRTKRKKKA